MTVLKVQNVSKVYQIPPQKRGNQKSFKDDLAHLVQHPFKIFSRLVNLSKRPSVKKTTEIPFKALDGVNFSLQSGEVLGIIGFNGSGKTTLLKILSGITRPTSGKVTLKGRFASLLAVGLGFHSDLSGRENIYLNGAILGFKKKELEKEIPDIIDFADIGQFIDTPVKFYSSGMYLRLAFSIATSRCLNPDILFIDEVLSVGDLAFQKKSLKRIKKMVRNYKTTIVIVSHNMEIIKELSNRCLWLDHGKIKMIGKSAEVIKEFEKISQKSIK